MTTWRLTLDRDPRQRIPVLTLYSDKHERWFKLRRPNFVRDPYGWILAPLICIETSQKGEYHYGDGYMISIPLIEKDKRGFHFWLRGS